MSELMTIGLDLAKNVFQVHGIDAEGKIIARRQLRRGDVLGFFKGLSPCLMGLEACGTAHHWARKIAALGHYGEANATGLRLTLCQARQD